MWSAWQTPGKLCSCGETADRCPFWSDVVSRYGGIADVATAQFMRGMNSRTLPIRNVARWPMALRRARNGSSDEARYLREVRGLYSALAATAAAQGYEAVVDSSKHPYWHQLAQLGALDPYAPRAAIRLVRHPRAVAYSLRRPRAERTQHGERDVQRAYSLRQAIPYWLVMNLVGDRAAGEGSILVRYEDLGSGASYVEQLERLGFLPHDQATSDSDGQWSHQFQGNSSRQGPAAEFRADTRWRSEPVSRREAAVWRMLVPVLRRYGYGAKPPE
jgi:hypothetical protein